MPFSSLVERRERLITRLMAARAVGQKTIGYFCIYAPLEMILASGAIGVRLNYSSAQSEARGERYLRADACSFCKVALGGFDTEDLYKLVDGVVNVSTCDMMRRLGEVIERFFRVPVFTLYLPRTSEAATWRLAEFRRQLDLFAGWLGSVTGAAPTDEALRSAGVTIDRLRCLLREIDSLRGLPSPIVSGTDILNLTALASSDPEAALEQLEDVRRRVGDASRADGGHQAVRPRLMLMGSVVTEDDRWLVEMIEEHADIVADALCAGMQWFAEGPRFSGSERDMLAQFYFGRGVCACRRPNDSLYAFVQRQIAERHVQGIVYKTLLYCDAWAFEVRRLHKKVGLPVLALDSDYSGQNLEQVRTRIEAFIEQL